MKNYYDNSLTGCIARAKADYADKPQWMWEDEGIVYAIQDYYSMYGEFSEEDIEVLEAYGFSEADFIED